MNPISSSQHSMNFEINSQNQINKTNPVKHDMFAEQPHNFETSTTVHYAAEWRNHIVSIADRSISNLKEEIENVNKKGPDHFFYPLSYEETLKRLHTDLDYVMQKKSGLLSIGSEFKTEDQVKSLIKAYFQINHSDLEEGAWKVFWPMIEREAKYSNDYYVTYTAHDKETELKMLNNHIKDSIPGHTCNKECFSKKTFRSISDLKHNSLEESFSKHIFCKAEFTTDHSPMMKTHFLSTNLSLFSNKMTAESTLSRALSRQKVEQIFPASDNRALDDKIKNIYNIETGILEQIFIRKDVATKLGYVSAPYGMPLSSNSDVVKESTVQILDAMQQNKKVDLNAIDSPYIIGTNQLEKMGERIGTPETSTQNFLKSTEFKDLQFRLMVLPELFNDGSSVLVFSDTLEGNQLDNKMLTSILNHEENELASSTQKATANKVMDFLSNNNNV